MASFTVEALPGERLGTSNAVLMFHRARGSFEGQFEDGEVESRLAFWKSLVREIEQQNADRLKLDLKSYKEKVKDEWWIYGKNNIAQNALDRLVQIRCHKDLVDAKESVTAQVLFFSFEEVYSKCPLLTSPIEIKE